MQDSLSHSFTVVKKHTYSTAQTQVLKSFAKTSSCSYINIQDLQKLFRKNNPLCEDKSEKQLSSFIGEQGMCIKNYLNTSDPQLFHFCFVIRNSQDTDKGDQWCCLSVLSEYNLSAFASENAEFLLWLKDKQGFNQIL